MSRKSPMNIQAEPPYPNHKCVVFAMRAPDWTAHVASKKCLKEYPHLISECGEFEIGASPADAKEPNGK